MFHFLIGITTAVILYGGLSQRRWLNLKRVIALVLTTIGLAIVLQEYTSKSDVIYKRGEKLWTKGIIAESIQNVYIFVFDNSSSKHNVSASFIFSMLLLQLCSFPIEKNTIKK